MTSMPVYEAKINQFDLRLKKLRAHPDASIKTMIRSLETRGQLTPLIAAQDDSTIVLVDGFKRAKAAQILNWPSLKTLFIPHAGALMKAHMYFLNRKNGFSMIEEAILIRELVDVDGMQQVEVATLLERHKSFVCRRLEMIRSLVPQLVEDIKLGLIPPGSGLSLAQLPQSNQGDLAATIQTHQLSAGETHHLIDLWRKAKDNEAREFLRSSPRKALNLAQTKKEPPIDPRIPQDCAAWLKTVQALENVATALRLKSKYAFNMLDQEIISLLRHALSQADVECQKSIAVAKQSLRVNDEQIKS